MNTNLTNRIYSGKNKGFFMNVVTVCMAIFILVGAVAVAGETKNVIFLIGDGYGLAQHVLTRIALVGENGQLPSDKLEALGLVKTHCLNSIVTDSAAAGTALATGRKTNVKKIGTSPDGRSYSSVATVAMRAGKAVGLVSDARITHATPASFLAHVKHRNDEETIAEQLLRVRPDVLLGGGWSPFIPRDAGGWRKDGRDLLAKARTNGYRVINNRKQLLNDDGKTGKLLGVFNYSHLTYVIDRDEKNTQPSLAEMTDAALRRLSKNDNGFFLMVEAGRIDHALHDVDITTMLKEAETFQEVVTTALNYASKDPDTLIVVTADHATGGVAISELLDVEKMMQQKQSVKMIAKKMKKLDSDKILPFIVANTGASLEDLQPWKDSIIEANKSKSGAKHEIAYALSQIYGVGVYHPVFQKKQKKTYGHSGEMVPLMASGPGAQKFAGILDNTDIPAIMARLMGLSLPVSNAVCE